MKTITLHRIDGSTVEIDPATYSRCEDILTGDRRQQTKVYMRSGCILYVTDAASWLRQRIISWRTISDGNTDD